MTNQEALDDLRDNGINLGAGDFVDVESLKIAAEALEKQIPKKVNISLRGTTDYNTSCHCPACRSIVGNNRAYCSSCGQALYWENNPRKQAK